MDPVKYKLLFERFLNPERISMPDFDIDFCMDGRDRVIEYVAEKYGRESVSQIITYGKAMHAFTNPDAHDPSFGTVYHQSTANRAWSVIIQFLGECLAR